MGINIVCRKDQMIKDVYQNKIRERKILGFPQENGPLKAYSNLFYWSHMVSDFGSVIPERPLIGFEILTYILKGAYESVNKDADQWHVLYEGDMEIIRAGKGIRVTEKLYPNTEILQIWLDPNFNQFKKMPSGLHQYSANSFPIKMSNGKQTTILKGKNAPIDLFSKDISINISSFRAGHHAISLPEDTILSAYLIDGYMDIDGSTLSKFDFFKIEESTEFEINALSDCKVFILTSPLKPEYEMYGAMRE